MDENRQNLQEPDSEQKDEASNTVVQPKAHLYSHVKISVKQINTLIIVCVVLIFTLIVVGVWLR